MGSLIETLYPVPEFSRSPAALLRWWESRRWLYNRVVGRTGLITVLGVLLVHPGRGDLLGPALIGFVVVYGVLANVCYSLGWLAELAARALWGSEAPDLGPLLFREGLVFSVLVTLFPLLLTILFTLGSLLS